MTATVLSGTTSTSAGLLTESLPDLVIDRLADQIAGSVRDHGAGHCVRVDNVQRRDAEALVTALRARLGAGAADVHLLADRVPAGPDAIAAERAVELRNRKDRPLVLVVPVGAGSAASSLDNSFARTDVAALLARAGDGLVAALEDPDLASAVRRIARELGRSRPVEAWARYVATVLADPGWDALGGALWMIGLVPDLGGADLVERIARNARCVRAISRPSRPVASVADRLTAAELQEGPDRDAIARHLSDPGIDLSDVPAWAATLGEPPRALTFEHWPLVERRTVEVTSLRIDPFLKDDGTLRAGNRLKQGEAGEMPFAEAGEDTPATVALVWRTDPVNTAAVDRWLLEALPPEDLRDADTEPVARQLVKGDKRRGTLRIDLGEEDLADGALLVVRVTALDDGGQPVRLTGGDEAVEESQQFAVRWEAEPLGTGGRRASTPSLPQARLQAALDGQDDLREDAPNWSGGTFSLRLGGRRTVQLALSPALVDLQHRALGERGRVVAWEAAGRLGEVLDPAHCQPVVGTLPYGLADRRRRLFDQLRSRQPRGVVEVLDWEVDGGRLREEVVAYCQSYRRALDSATGDEARSALLAIDTLTLNVATAGHSSIGAVLVLPLHPMRLAWAAEYDATLSRWARELGAVGRAPGKRRQSVDIRLVERVTPANLPFAVLGVDGSPFVHVREATLGTGVYLDPAEAEPGAAVQAVFDVLGLDRRDVTPEIPPALVAERIGAYRTAHPGQEAMRLIVYNGGSGEVLAQALGDTVLRRTEDDDEPAAAPARLEVTAYSRRPSYTDPLPALTDLQRRVGGQEVRGTRSYLTPPLGVSVRPAARLVTDRRAAHLGVVSDVAIVRAGGDPGGVAVPDPTTSFRNLLTPATSQRVAGDASTWRTAPAVRPRGRDGATEAVDAHRAYQAALAGQLGHDAPAIALSASLGPAESAALQAVHERSDWVLTLDRNLGIDHYSAGDRTPYVLDYAPDFLEGLGPRLTVTTTHRGEVQRLLADAMDELDLAAVDSSVRVVLDHLQVVSGRLALRLIGRTSLATEAVSLAALMAHLRRRGELDGAIVVPVDAHQEVFGAGGADASARRCDVILVRTTARTMRMDCIEVKSRRASTIPAALVDEIVEQLDSTVAMLRDSFFRVDPPRIDAELQRARLGGILRHHADRALAMGLLDATHRADVERLVERVEDGALVPEIGRRGYVVSLGGPAGLPAEHRGVRIEVLTAADLGAVGLAASVREGALAAGALPAGALPAGALPADPPSVDPRPAPMPEPELTPPARRPSPTPRSRTVAAPPAPAIPPAAPPPSPSPPAVTPPAVTPPRSPTVEAGGGPRSVEVLLGQDAHAADVRWRISTDGSPHLFVLGIPGQGKSVTTRRILNSFAEQGLPALVVDFHGDMAAAPAGGAAVLDAAQGLPISPFETGEAHTRYAQAAWELSEVVGYVCGLGEIQRNVVYEGVRELYRQHGFGAPGGPTGMPTMDELGAAVAAAEGTGRGRNVAARLRPLTDFGLFVDPVGDRGFGDLLRQGMVVDLHGLMEQVQVAAGAFLLRKVYREMFGWGQTRQLRLAVVLDEAHRLARDVTLPKIMKEGRKYGVAVVVASQGVDDFHRDVLANAGTKVSFRCNPPQSRTIARFLRGRAGQDVAEALERLAVGQAYVSTPDHAVARKVFMARDS